MIQTHKNSSSKFIRFKRVETNGQTDERTNAIDWIVVKMVFVFVIFQ